MIKFSNEQNLAQAIESDLQIINSYLLMQNVLAEQLSLFINNKTNKINLDVAIINLNRLKQNISLLNNLLDVLENLKQTRDYLTNEGLKTYIVDYNSLFSNNITVVFSYTSNIEKFINELSLEINTIDKNESCSNLFSNINSSIASTNIVSEASYHSLLNNTLVISETKKQVILPFNLENIELYYKNNLEKYSSIDDVINKYYTFPISHFKPYSISRFKEAYKLVRKRAKGSHLNALSLAFEMFANYNLHPAIIASCKSLDDLDIYLSCLEDNALDEFRIFNIKYEICPVVSKKNCSTQSIEAL